MTFGVAMDHVAQAVEIVGVALLGLGLVWSFVLAGHRWRQSGQGLVAYRQLRETFGAVLLLGLEILVAADLIRTIAVEPSIENVAALGLVVLIRTFLSFSLQIELQGTLPWRSRDEPAGKSAAPSRGGAGTS